MIMRRVFIVLVALLAVATASALPQPRTVEYAVKDGEHLMLDHYVAEGVEGLRPCVIFLFGGAFHHGDRAHKDYLDYFDALTRAGYDVVSIDYRLGLKDASSDGGMVEMIKLLMRAINYAAEDLFSATRFLLDHAAEWNIDTTRIVATGSSAGAIACLQAENYICNGDKRAELLNGYNYAGVISYAGAVFSTSGRPKWQSEPCPMLLFHGTSDSNVPYKKASTLGVGLYGSLVIYKQMKRMGAPCHLYAARYRSHIMAEEPMTRNMHEILYFLETSVKGGDRLQTLEQVEDLAIEKQRERFRVKDYLASNYGV